MQISAWKSDQRLYSNLETSLTHTQMNYHVNNNTTSVTITMRDSPKIVIYDLSHLS